MNCAHNVHIYQPGRFNQKQRWVQLSLKGVSPKPLNASVMLAVLMHTVATVTFKKKFYWSFGSSSSAPAIRPVRTNISPLKPQCLFQRTLQHELMHSIMSGFQNCSFYYFPAHWVILSHVCHMGLIHDILLISSRGAAAVLWSTALLMQRIKISVAVNHWQIPDCKKNLSCL